MTNRQREALAWLEDVGKASTRLVRRHGFAPRTFEALARERLIDSIPITEPGTGRYVGDVYRPRRERTK